MEFHSPTPQFDQGTFTWYTSPNVGCIFGDDFQLAVERVVGWYLRELVEKLLSSIVPY